MSASIAPYRRHEALPVPITRRGRALQTVGGPSHLFDALSAWPVCRVTYSILRFRGLLAPGSTPRANRLGGGRRPGRTLPPVGGCRVAGPARGAGGHVHRDAPR